MSIDFRKTSKVQILWALTATSTIASLCFPVNASALDEQPVPDFMKVVSINSGKAPTAGETASTNLFAINNAMFPIYDHGLAVTKQHIRQRLPVIIATSDASGGQLTLFRPGHEMVTDTAVPAIYRQAKTACHTALAIYVLLAPYCADSKADPSWRYELAAYRLRVQSGLSTLSDLDCIPENRQLIEGLLKKALAFMDTCLNTGSFTYSDLEAYARGAAPDIKQLANLAADAQVSHCYDVIGKWKQLLGAEWEHTYAISTCGWVTRQNNIYTSIFVQFMGENALNDRIILLEGAFGATPDSILESLARILSDRSLGKTVFNDYRLMDFELLGSAARRSIERNAAKLGQKAILPPLVPFNSHEWPWHTNPASGSGPATMEEE